MPRNQSASSGRDSNRRVALFAAVLCIGLVIFVFTYDDLRRDPFVQGITGILVALGIAVVLFSAVPGSKAKLRLPLGLAGAAAFYYVLLPQIKSYVFPLYSYTGYVALKCDNQQGTSFSPVQGASVVVKDTNLKAETDGVGKFTLPDVPSQINVSELFITRGGDTYRVSVKDAPDNVFNIPPEPAVVKSGEQIITAGEWADDTGKCQADSPEKKYAATKQIALNKSVLGGGGYSSLLIEVAAQEGAEIVNARKLAPAEGNKVQSEEVPARVQRWQIPLTDGGANIRLSVCLGALKKGIKVSGSALRTKYWFQKVETGKCSK